MLDFYSNGLFRVLGIFLLEEYETIKKYIENSDKSKSNIEVDENIKKLVKKLIIQKAESVLFVTDTKISNLIKTTNKNITALFRYLINNESEFLSINKKNLTSVEHLKTSLVYQNLNDSWKRYEALMAVVESQPQEISTAELKFKINFIELAIQVKKHLEKIKNENMNTNKWFLVWINKLLIGINSFLSIAKKNKDSSYGFYVFQKEKTGLIGIQNNSVLYSIKDFLENKKTIEDLFPIRLKNMSNTLASFKLFYSVIENFYYLNEKPNLSSGINPPELLLAGTIRTI